MQNTSAIRRLFESISAVAVFSILAIVARADDSLPLFRSTDVPFRTMPDEKVGERFQLADHEFTAIQRFRRHWLGIAEEFEVTFSSPVETPYQENNVVACEYFRPLNDGPFPAVIVLHILGGDFELSRMVCRTLASNGVAALFLKMPYYGPRRPANSKRRMISIDLEETVEGMTQAVLDIRRATAWLANQPDVDPERLGITGISLGGIVGCLAAANEPRLKRGCFILAGGDLPVIILESDETKDIRDHYRNKDVDLDQVKARLSEVDPLTYAGQMRGRTVLMFNAKNDKVVPPDCTDKLWRALGKPEIEWWNANHYSAIVYLPKGLARMTRFFQARRWESRSR